MTSTTTFTRLTTGDLIYLSDGTTSRCGRDYLPVASRWTAGANVEVRPSDPAQGLWYDSEIHNLDTGDSVRVIKSGTLSINPFHRLIGSSDEK